ncbi:MAG TPA: TolC family protein [Deferrisomatales bacterium]|nr:TolC family protein [Deferrisomatales bacterium]
MRRVCMRLAAVWLTAGWAAGAPAAAAELRDLEQKLVAGPEVADLVAYAYQASPTILAAQQGWRATVERHRVATGYPEPQVMFTWFLEPIETRLGPQDWNATLSQMIPFPGKLSSAGEVVAADARIARLQLDQAVREVVVKVRESAHELTYIRSARDVAAQNRSVLDEVLAVAESSYADNGADLADVVRAQSQSAQLSYDSLLLEELEQTEIARLNALLNREPEAAIGSITAPPLVPLAYSLEEIYRLAEVGREEIGIAGERVAKMDAKRSLAGYQNLPDFRVGLFYAGIGDPDVAPAMRPDDAGRDAIGIQAGVSVPLWFGSNAGRTAEALAEREQARALKVAVVNDTRAQVRSLTFRLHNAERLVLLYRDQLLPQATRSLSVAETRFRAGEGSFSDFAETQASYYNFQLALARAHADYGKYLSGLERLAGRGLTRREDAAAAPAPPAPVEETLR